MNKLPRIHEMHLESALDLAKSNGKDEEEFFMEILESYGGRLEIENYDGTISTLDLTKKGKNRNKH